MTHLILVRHGLSVTNKQRLFTGQKDVPLAPQGHEQAERTAAYLVEHASIDCIYASDLMRTCQTVEPLAKRLGMEICTCRDLREINVGAWEGVSFEDVKRQSPEDYAHYVNDPGSFRFAGGESYADLTARATLAISRIVAKNDGKTVVIGTHGGLLRCLIAAWSGIPVANIKAIPPVPNCSLTVAEADANGVRLLQKAFDEHLRVSSPERDEGALV